MEAEHSVSVTVVVRGRTRTRPLQVYAVYAVHQYYPLCADNVYHSPLHYLDARWWREPLGYTARWIIVGTITEPRSCVGGKKPYDFTTKCCPNKYDLCSNWVASRVIRILRNFQYLVYTYLRVLVFLIGIRNIPYYENESPCPENSVFHRWKNTEATFLWCWDFLMSLWIMIVWKPGALPFTCSAQWRYTKIIRRTILIILRL